MWKIIIVAIMAMHMSATTMQPTSKESNPSNIPSLESRANKLDDDVALWSRWSLFFVALTAFSAVAYGVSQGYLVARSKQATKVRSDLIAAKDQQLKRELASRDERIAQVKSDADVKIAEVKSDSDQKIAAANKRSDEISAESNRKARELEQQNLTTAEKLANANKALEDEKIKRLEMEASLAPRMLPLEWSKGTTNFEPLNRFAGMNVLLEYAPDAEARRATDNIGSFVHEAGWIIKELAANPEMYQGFFDGVLVSAYGTNRLEKRTQADVDEETRCIAAAETLVGILKSYGWQAKFLAREPEVDPAKKWLPPNTVKIRIGMKPSFKREGR